MALSALLALCGSYGMARVGKSSIKAGEGVTGSAFSNKKRMARSAGPDPVGTSCVTGEEDHLCLALKYSVYKDSDNKAVVSSSDAEKNIADINKVWSKCNMGFQIEEYNEIVPKDLGLEPTPSDMSELTKIRSDLDNDSTLLVVTTPEWNMGGSANAWTAMPGEMPFGAVLESTVGTFANIIGHELGHYVGLDHESDSSNLMNPVIYDDSTELTPAQCETAREIASSDWERMLR